jgi:hypothetical protein
MNERIREFAEQATTRKFDGTGTDMGKLVLDQEKFAELIVAECMKLNSKELSITAIERLIPLYKEHFGIPFGPQEKN